jgi:hypothetical protein
MSLTRAKAMARCGAVAAMLVTVTQAPAFSAGPKVEDFFGTWLPTDQRAKCSVVEDWGEGPQIIIGKDHFEFGDGPPCEEVNMRLEGSTLKVGASCESGEAGYRAVVAEFQLSGQYLIYKNKKQNNRFVRCTPG